jgi:hypothetical protein
LRVAEGGGAQALQIRPHRQRGLSRLQRHELLGRIVQRLPAGFDTGAKPPVASVRQPAFPVASARA